MRTRLLVCLLALVLGLVVAACESGPTEPDDVDFSIDFTCAEASSQLFLGCDGVVTGLDPGALKTCTWTAQGANSVNSTSTGPDCSGNLDFRDFCASTLERSSVSVRLTVASGGEEAGPLEKRFSICPDGG